MPLLCPRCALVHHASNRAALASREVSPALPGSGGRGGRGLPAGTCFSRAPGGSRSPKLVWQSFIVACYAKLSFLSSSSPQFDIREPNKLAPVLKRSIWPLPAHNLSKR